MKCGIIKKTLKIYFCAYKFQYQSIKVNITRKENNKIVWNEMSYYKFADRKHELQRKYLTSANYENVVFYGLYENLCCDNTFGVEKAFIIDEFNK
jgi:hypothetical protein